jgi:Mg-chelatase subunit ChlD
VIAHPANPTRRKIEPFLNQPVSDLEIEESLEENPRIELPEDLLVESKEEKPFSCVFVLDTSSSMSGDKHLLASIAVAVLVLKVPSKDFAIVVFSSDAKPIKPIFKEEEAESVILKFLKHQPRGFTNLGLGLEAGLKQLGKLTVGKRKVGLIATDGRTTEGANPVVVARQFDFLVVLHLSGAGGDIEVSRMMAQAGHGICLEVERFEDLPKKLYEALRMLSRR